ncbi:MAG: hypothetical protein ACE5H9_19970 [Anaerolineae bacterium]
MDRKKLLIVLWLGISVMVTTVLALAVSPLTIRAQPTLPPRNTITPTPPPGDDDGPPLGAYIELSVPGAPAGVWTGVQWQDANGDWQIVEGWQGTLDSGGKRWWVAPKDFATGPFRWTVFQGQGGPVLGSSQPFNLPGEAQTTTQVTVLLSP